MTNNRDEQKAWVQAVASYKKLSLSALAVKAGVAQTTITRFMNSDDANHLLSGKTLGKLAGIAGLRPLEFPPKERRIGFAEADQYEIAPNGSGTDLDAAIHAVIAGSNNVHPWVLKSVALDTAGYRPGDVLIVDMTAEPRPGDLVCAQVHERGGASTMFRFYEPPYLLAASSDPAFRFPILITPGEVEVAGVVLHSFRSREAA